MSKELVCIQPMCIFASYNPHGKMKRFCDNPLATVVDNKGYLRMCPYTLLLKAMAESGCELTAIQRDMLELAGVKLEPESETA